MIRFAGARMLLAEALEIAERDFVSRRGHVGESHRRNDAGSSSAISPNGHAGGQRRQT